MAKNRLTPIKTKPLPIKQPKKKETGVLKIMYGNKVLKEFLTENVYALYNTLKSLSKRDTGTYANLPKNFKAVFVEKSIN